MKGKLRDKKWYPYAVAACIAAVAAQEGYIKPEDVRRLLAFRDNPSDESWIGGTK